MSRLRSIAAIIFLQYVLSGLAIPYKGHHQKGHRHGHKHEMQHDSHKSHTNHHSSKHRTATGDLRESVPTPLQDFVLVSGSPLFHERPRASDGKNNTAQTAKDQKVSQEPQGQGHAANQTVVKEQGQVLAVPLSIQAAEANQLPKQEQKQPGDISTSTTSGPILEQVHGNSTQQNLPPALKTAFKPPKEFATAGLSKGGEQQKEKNGSTTSEPTVLLTLQAPKNSSLGTRVDSNAQGNTSLSNVDQSQAFQGANTSLALGGIIIGEQKVNGPKGNQTNMTITADVKPNLQGQQEGTGNFPFNIPGMRNYGNGNSENKGAERNKQMTDKEKLGLGENLGPDCHWKTTMGEKGKLVTSVSCFGEFKKPDDNKVGMHKVGKKPLPEKGETIESKQTPAGNTSVSGTAGDEKENHEQSDKEFEDEAVATTNAFRKIHRALPMKLSPELSRQAKEYAEKIAGMGSLQHDYDAVKQLDEGENLAMGCKQYGVPLTAKEAIANWYNEVCSYDFDRGEFSMSTGHFTQVVWSDSKEFGIGKAAGQQNGMPCTFVVGRFKPSGNYKGEHKRNVFKGTFDPSYCDKLNVKKLL